MADRFHLEGLGLVGALTAAWLDAHGREFTWHDTDEDVCAWRACTGLAYPSGLRLDNEQLARWLALLSGSLPVSPQIGQCLVHFRELLAPHCEQGTWCFYSMHAPHNGHARIVQQVGRVNVSDVHTFHLNAQTFVTAMRERFAALRLPVSLTGQPLHDSVTVEHTPIVTHGFAPETIGTWSWGWSAQVHLDLHPALERLPHRPTFYMRDGFTLDYAYPVPGKSTEWYAGTSLITQRQPHTLDVLGKWTTWSARMMDKLAGAAMIGRVESLQQAWRPMPTAEFITPVRWSRDGTLFIRPQYGSGVRHWWVVADALTEALAL